ncbi:MAG TPA: hypothetical protein VMS31_08575 [Pyrinomonadaceae bacterium]|nr:hypothetical protein [Pyrinomonadaceae bacterium]
MATKIQSLTVPARDKAEHKCQCGCASCEGTCCSLDCIVKPRFFCGQLLTDADLSAMLKWARDRFGLSRYRHGWGVVCGLDVRCDPEAPTSVIVTPGYAVNCCGDDVIVCETATLDLKGACKAEEDPCADLRRERDSLNSMKRGNEIAVKVGNAIARKRGVDLSAGPPTPGEVLEAARVVDIYLSYTEQPTDPSTALGRSSCKQTPECEYSRTRESYKLSWEIGLKGIDPVRTRAENWYEGYESCIEVLETFKKKFGQNFPAKEVREWLLRWIDEHPQYQLCGLRELLCQQEVDYFANERNLVLVLFGLVQNCRNAYLQCECFGCDDDMRVPLARVWLTPDNGTSGSCRILAIDPYPPYRRPIQPECWPAPLGFVNVGRFIWHRREEVCSAVHGLGLKVNFGAFQLPATLNELQKKLNCNLFVGCDEQRTALVYDAGPLGNRVVGFCEGGAPPPPPECPTITVVPELKQVSAGTPAKFKVQLQPTVAGVTFSWTVDAGTISAGQGTASLTVDTTGLSNRPIVATVTIGGLDPACNKTAEGAALVIAKQPPPCPTITVLPDLAEIPAGTPAVFKVHLDRLVANPTFTWKVSAGTVTSGQGTEVLTVDTKGQAGKTILAEIDVGGLDPACQRTATGEARVLPEFNCPIISVFALGNGADNEPIVFRAELQPDTFHVTYNWSISAGAIQSGQGTREIQVGLEGLAGQTLTATVEIGGLPPNCPRTDSDSVTVAGGRARKVNEFFDMGETGFENAESTKVLNDFAAQLQKEPTVQGFIITFGGVTLSAAEINARSAQNYLINNREIDPPRIVAKVAEDNRLAGEAPIVQLWIVPPGAPPPPFVIGRRVAPADDLTVLKGIAASRLRVLNDEGIRTFADLAATDPKRLKELIPTASDDDRARWITESKKRAG